MNLKKRHQRAREKAINGFSRSKLISLSPLTFLIEFEDGEQHKVVRNLDGCECDDKCGAFKHGQPCRHIARAEIYSALLIEDRELESEAA